MTYMIIKILTVNFIITLTHIYCTYTFTIRLGINICRTACTSNCYTRSGSFTAGDFNTINKCVPGIWTSFGLILELEHTSDTLMVLFNVI